MTELNALSDIAQGFLMILFPTSIHNFLVSIMIKRNSHYRGEERNLKMAKRPLASLLALCMVFGTMGTIAFAEETM